MILRWIDIKQLYKRPHFGNFLLNFAVVIEQLKSYKLEDHIL